MTNRTVSDLFVILGMSVTWLIGIPLTVGFFTKIVGWPLNLAMLALTPMFAVWVPISYRISVLHNRRYVAGQDLGLSTDVLVRAGILGALTGLLSLAAVLLYMFTDASEYFAVIAIGTVFGLLSWQVIRVYKQIVKEITMK